MKGSCISCPEGGANGNSSTGSNTSNSSNNDNNDSRVPLRDLYSMRWCAISVNASYVIHEVLGVGKKALASSRLELSSNRSHLNVVDGKNGIVRGHGSERGRRLQV